MDGVQGRVGRVGRVVGGGPGRSLQFRLSAWLAVVILLSAVAAGVFAFQAAFHEANEVQDGQLKEVATLVTAANLPFMQEGSASYVPDAEPTAKVIVQVLGTPGTLAGRRGQDLPADLRDGIQTIKVDGRDWRVVVRTLDSRTRVAVGQQTSDRNEIARNNAAATLIPFAVLAPVLVGVVIVLVRQMFKPLTRLAADLDDRSEQDLSEIPGTDDARLPAEIVPFLVANNRLLARVAQSVALQRRFVADAAHELRSPLTALLLQAERLDVSEMSAQARHRFAAMRHGLMRTRALVEQLLTLARVQESSGVERDEVSVSVVFRQVLEDLMPIAEARQLDIGVSAGKDLDACVPASETDLVTLLKNLVDNAIRYTPNGGRVDLSVCREDGLTSIFVDDTGPGIARDERERVFDRFYRVLGTGQSGSGLGLAIVQTIAARLGAQVILGDAPWSDGRSGLRVAVVFRGRLAPAEGG